MNKNISIWRGSNTPPTKYHLWLKDDNKLYKHIQDNLWKSLSDNIVSSVDELDPNAPQGSLASVAVNTISEVPFSELYQPTSDEVNLESGVIDTTNLLSVSRISINSSYDTSIEIQEFEVYLFSKDFNMQGGVGQVILLVPTGAITMNFATQEQNGFELFTLNEDGTITVNEENLAIINNLLSSTEFVYGGIISEDPSCVDIFYKTIGGIQRTDLYIKEVEGWRPIEAIEAVKEQIDDLKTSVENLEDKADLIVNSVDELPQDAQAGTLASVLEDYSVRTKVSSFKNVANNEHIWEVDIVISESRPGQGQIASELVSKDGTESIFLNIAMQGNTLNFSYTEGGNTIPLGDYNFAGTPSILKVNREPLKALNEKLKTNEFVYVKHADSSKYPYWFVPTILKKYKKTILYTKNGLGWEQCAVGGPYNFAEDLPQNAPLGSLATVLKDYGIPVSEDFAPNKTVKEFIWSIPEKLSKEFLNSYTTNGGTRLRFKETSLVDYIEFTNYLGYPSLIYSYYPSSPKVIAKYDTEGNLISKDLSGTEYINSVTKTYTTSSINPARFDVFLSVPEYVGSTSYLYVKNKTGWEQYSELVDQSVTTEKVADGAIAMGKLAEDVQETINSTNGKVLIVGSIDELDPNAPQGSLAVVAFYDEVQTINETTLYIKEADGWKEFKTGSEVVNNLEEGGIDKALSAEMGKFLNEKISNVVSGTTTDPIKFKGYVNVDNKNGIDTMFGLLSEGEACLVAPSVDTGNGDSYKTWVSSAINQEQITLGTELFKTSHNITVSNVLSGKPLEVKTFLKLDEAQPYCQCPDMILLCKIKVKAKDFVEFVDGISPSIASVIPDSLMLTACIGKVLRWSAGDWLLNNPDKYSLTHKYGYNTDIDTALESGIIGYTATCTSGMPGGITENYTVIINASSDSDPTFRTIQQIAYGRTGAATNRVWTRILFKNVMGGIDNFLPWVEITKNTNILPNVNGWLLNPDDCLETGVYQTCNSGALNGIFTNNYFTMFVNASTSPNGDGYDAIEQTAYGIEADEGKIYRRVIFYHKANNIKQYGVWIKLDDSNLYKELEHLTEEYFPSKYATKDEVSTAIANAITAEPAEGEEVEDYVLMKSDIEHIIPHVVDQTDSVATIQPNVLNVWGEVESLDITLAEPTDNTIINEYMAQFTSGSTATTLTLPNTIKWMSAPNIQPNKTYQISIINNLGVIGEFSHE